MKDYVVYGDTDSLYINMGGFIDGQIGTDWHKLPDDKKIFYIKKLSAIIEDNVNSKSYRETQRKFYNSNDTDFRILFKQEVIAKSALFISKKRYAMWNVDEEGAPVDKIKNIGLEIVRSETPVSIKPKLKELVSMILRNVPDSELKTKMSAYKSELFKAPPHEICVNIGITDIEKYSDSKGDAVKGAPWHVKGALNYRKLLKILHLEDKYENISAGGKAKVVYLKKNQYNMDTITFHRWPVEFDEIIQIDYNRLIENFFTNKAEMLLSPMGKVALLNAKETSIDMFF